MHGFVEESNEICVGAEIHAAGDLRDRQIGAFQKSAGTQDPLLTDTEICFSSGYL